MKEHIFFRTLVILMLILTFINIGFASYIYNDHYLKDGYFKIVPSYEISNEAVEADGFYREDKFYCIWTQGKTEEAMNKTECHEVCHHLAYIKEDHFCQ